MRLILTALCLLLIGSTSTASDPITYDLHGVAVVGWDRLSPTAQAILTDYLQHTPYALTPWLRVITVDGAPVPEPLALEVCAPNGEVLYRGPCGFNVWSSTSGGENPFPPDAPESAWVNGFLAVVNHEYGHQIGHGTAVEQGWVNGLIAEAGDEPRHYLRSMVEWGYFRQNPQEFLASMWNQWGACSRCTLRLALTRWDAGTPHPLNQVILLLALSGFRHGFLDDDHTGTVMAHRMEEGTPVLEFWSVRLWQCGGRLSIAGPSFRLNVTLDPTCHVLSVDSREGL